jgi:hypothetical protein
MRDSEGDFLSAQHTTWKSKGNEQSNSIQQERLSSLCRFPGSVEREGRRRDPLPGIQSISRSPS